MYWGDEHIPLRQVRRALTTWIGDPRLSRADAAATAREILRHLDNPAATKAARRTLLRMVEDFCYTADFDRDILDRDIRDVFEPGAEQARRAVGHPAAPLVADSMINLIQARLAAIEGLSAGEINDQALYQARQVHLLHYAEYALQQPALSVAAPTDRPGLYEPVTVETALNNSCGHLLTAVGLVAADPAGADALSRIPTPQFISRPSTENLDIPIDAHGQARLASSRIGPPDRDTGRPARHPLPDQAASACAPRRGYRHQ